MRTTEQKIEMAFKSKNEAMIEMLGLNQDSNIFNYGLKLMYALKYNYVTSGEYDDISKKLQRYCKLEEIETSNEIVSLF
ncbi:hypothetical protein MM236_01190 [Belliella sp. DSM 107340]|uniref:Uncharacterized protein n=1 Tax=Belliella calami TaxID=2923436 RepID=A0ABS9UIY0_9BACT|nr:hypothetical protein [Belliella calami]MCH7396576.1 hypothetical protein [Belliella calami]